MGTHSSHVNVGLGPVNLGSGLSQIALFLQSGQNRVSLFWVSVGDGYGLSSLLQSVCQF